jgi:ADP-ribose pyrophosphatase YjhB (NUDIX family)
VQAAARIRAIAANGLLFSTDSYDIERYEEARALAEEILAGAAGVEVSAVRAMFDEPGYVTPKVDVRAVVFDGEGRVLLDRERADGLWSLPGGWAETTDSPREAVERELLEEAFIRGRVRRLLAVIDRARHPHTPQPHRVYKLVIECEALEELPFDCSGEVLERGFFSFEDLPPLSTTRVTASWLLPLQRFADGADGFLELD